MPDAWHAWLTWYHNSGLTQATIAVPLVETTLLLLTLTLCLFFRYARVGLILAFLFLYRWGWTVQIQKFTLDPTLQAAFSAGYLAFGVLVFTFTVVSMLFQSGSANE